MSLIGSSLLIGSLLVVPNYMLTPEVREGNAYQCGKIIEIHEDTDSFTVEYHNGIKQTFQYQDLKAMSMFVKNIIGDREMTHTMSL